MTDTKKENSEEQVNQAVKEEIEDVETPVIDIPDPAESNKPDYEKDYLYLRAEFDNYKKQAIKERSQLLKYGAERLAIDLLETIDVFNSALENKVTAENYEEFVKGIELTHQQLKSTLEKHGIKELPAVGEVFDPTKHEALSSLATSDFAPGHIAQVFKAPYNYHDKLLRAGQVIVAKEKSSEE